MNKTYTISKLLLTTIFVLFTVNSFSQTIINQEKFETGFGIWTPGGGNVTRQNSVVYNGTNSVRFRGTTNMDLISNPTNILAYNKVDIKFFIASSNITSGETMILQYKDLTASSWQNVKTVTIRASTAVRDINIVDTYHAIHATIFNTTHPFSSTAQFRFLANLGSTTRYFYIDNVSIIGTTFTTPTKGPGGITANLETWLKADKVNGTGVSANNTPVDSWQDMGKGNDANVIDTENTTLTNKPSFRNNPTNNVNFNPVVYFNNDNLSGVDYTGLTNRAELNATSGFFSHDQFIVALNENGVTLSSNTGTQDIFCGQVFDSNTYDQDISGIGFGDFTNRMTNEIITYCIGTSPTPTPSDVNSRGYGISQSGSTTYTNFLGIINARQNTALLPTRQELHYNALSISNLEVGVPQYRSYSNTRFWLGRSQAFNGSFNGRIAEAITFSSRKNDVTERRRIESYLAIKYGITLGTNGTAMDYQNSDGSVIWSQSVNIGYNFNIAGIGRDDLADLTQKQSRSSNSTAEVAIGLGVVATTNTANTNSFTTDKSFLVWGSNNAPLAATGTTTTNITLGSGVTTTFIGAQRKYKIVETGGDVAQTVVSIPKASLLSSFPKTGTQEYVLIVSSTANFASADIIDVIPMTDTGTDFETWYDFDQTKFFTFGVANISTTKYRLENNTSDFILGEKSVNLNSAFTVSAWIKTSASGTFIAKNGAYQFYVNAAGKIVGNWNSGDRIVSNTLITTGKYHYVAITFSAGIAKIYIDGVLDVTTNSRPTPIANLNNFSIGALWASKGVITSTFMGDIDEVRIWNSELTDTQLRYIMNQEIQKNGSNTFGAIVPNTITKNDIITIPWSNLQAYYNINNLYGTSIKDLSDNNRWARIKYLDSNNILIENQTAPLPYVSVANGLWQNNLTWTNGSVQTLPNAPSIVNNLIPVNWNIVQTQNAVESQGNRTVLGLLVTSNTLSATNNSKIEVTHYLKLNGKIDLVAESQLIQTLNSDLDVTSTGSIERDQKGKTNKFDYNYWSSPVNTINATVNNGPYTVAGVLKDGTTSTPQDIQWTGSFNGSPTTPITLSSYWIYKFQTASNQYANWVAVGQNGSLNPAQGFTMKGSGTTGTTNYTFLGKPNNGKIQFNMGPNLINLTGNPYTSALNGYQFISDNLSSTNGTIYFWDHFGGETHILLQYQGGYATLNLTGGVPAQSHPILQNTGPGTKIPKQFIPVGQGFFINSSNIGGDIVFNNNQRDFVKETETTSNALMRNAISSVPESDYFTINDSDFTEENDGFIKIRLGYNSRNDYHRQVLLGFMNENATSEIDAGYDAVTIDSQVNDMCFIHGDSKLVIQGDGYFNPENIYPISVKCDALGTVKFMIDATENLDPQQEIYIFDNMTGIYHSIKNTNFEIELPEGTHDRRFSLRFTTQENLGSGDHQLTEGIQVVFTSKDNILHIKNKLIDTQVISATVFNIIGQQLTTYDIENQAQQFIQIPISNLSTGTYIVKIQTTKGNLSQKIIIK